VADDFGYVLQKVYTLEVELTKLKGDLAVLHSETGHYVEDIENLRADFQKAIDKADSVSTELKKDLNEIQKGIIPWKIVCKYPKVSLLVLFIILGAMMSLIGAVGLPEAIQQAVINLIKLFSKAP